MRDLARQLATVGGLLLVFGGAGAGAVAFLLALPVLAGYGLEPLAVRFFVICAGLVTLGVAALVASDRLAQRRDP